MGTRVFLVKKFKMAALLQLVKLFEEEILRTTIPTFRLKVCKMKNSKNPQTLPEYRSGWTISRKSTSSSIRFLFGGSNIRFASFTRRIIWASLKNRQNGWSDHWISWWKEHLCTNSLKCYLFHSMQTEFLGDFCFSSIFHSFRLT